MIDFRYSGMTLTSYAGLSDKTDIPPYAKGVSMKARCSIFIPVMFALLLYSASGKAAGTVTLEPVRAPSMGPDDAPVTIIEIVDYM
jgi:hypothetical protein